EQQILEFRPKVVCVWSEEKAKELKGKIAHLDIPVYSGMDGLIACATEKSADIVVGAVVGMIGIQPTIEAIKAGKDIAIANKETLVTAGHIIMPLVKEKNVALLPVDSEHSAIFQVLHGEEKREVSKVILTASGGPFRGKTVKDLENIQVEDALKHPNWAMGQKITIDSSTMINKGLEVMEAKWLFDVDFDQIEVVIQPQSVIHSMVEFKDGAVLAQLGTPDMRLPIQYALYYPERRPLSGKRLDLFALSNLTFEEPDIETFKGLKLAYEAMTRGGNIPVAYNAANEKAVALFLNRQIRYLEITDIIEETMKQTGFIENPTLEQILETEQEAYEFIGSRW
ncbi:MAG: 1-deoxy-D-xylulose-5-phosphate reductoisomerase, partial [Agathobacter sp.]|nr:1-deoxy-D-xylulose-5-phosphate reductoisomerase [Agathobacter sp.]